MVSRSPGTARIHRFPIIQISNRPNFAPRKSCFESMRPERNLERKKNRALAQITLDISAIMSDIDGVNRAMRPARNGDDDDDEIHNYQ